MKKTIKNNGRVRKPQQELDVIDLDRASGWSKLNVTGEMAGEEAFYGETPKGLTEDELEYLNEEELEYLNMDEEVEEDEPKTYGLMDRISEFFSRFHTMDKVIAATGLVILVLAIATAGVFWGKKAVEQQVEALAPIGEQLETVGILGENTLVAIADARKAMEETARLEEELLKEYEEEEISTEVKVVMKLTSVQRDLKIKFVNEKSGKLVGNIPFEVKITDANGKTYTRKDEDQDGIIYLTDLEPGNYTVSMVALDNLKDYSFSTNTQKVKVKESIDYQKIDVSDEVKKESEVDVSKEDTSAKIETEATLADTVEWVESTRTEIATGSTYTRINKSDITEPTLQAALELGRSFLRTTSTGGTVSGGDLSGGQGNGDQTTNPDGSQTPDSGNGGTTNPDGGQTPGSGNGGTTNPDGGQTPDSGNGGTTSPDGGQTPGSGNGGTTNPDGGQTPGSGPAVDNTKPAVESITLSPATLSIEEGKTANLTAAVLPDHADNKTVTYTSSDNAIAKVDANGVITAVKAGTVTITAKAGEKTAACTVTVTAKPVEVKITLNKTTVSLKTGESITLIATVTPAGKTISWSSSSPNIATVENGKIVAKAAGQTTITATVEGKSAACTVTVTASYDPRNDTTKNLTTRDGQQVYYYSNGQYVAAKVADYYKYDTFYKMETTSQYRYTGWQNLDGKTYYFDRNGNKITGEQVIQGAKYMFNSDGSLNTGSGVWGIDVSKWNGSINWEQVKNAGVSYVIIRTGFRGSTQGALVEDANFRANIEGATRAGLKVGVYFFTQAVNEVEAVEEASMVINQIRNYKISYPVFIDVESSGGRADGLDAGTRTRVINAFCQTIQNSGYQAGIYANKTWLNQKMNISALSGYKIWLAQYNTQPTYGGRYDMWQYSDKGSVPGIKGNVDMNLSYMSY